MEKKVPERKVSLRDEDVFYVYDKRINKCIKEGCEGTVKYGLVLRVSVSEEETINCFDCNKCHMKYTPYPNYVRLSKTDMMTIYNQEEVTARDQKRAEDAAKQAARDKRKNGPKSFGNKSFENRSFENRSFEGRSFEKKPFEKKPYEKKAFGVRAYEKKPFERKSYERNSYERSSFEKAPFERKSYERKPFDSRNSEYKSSYGRNPYEKSSFEKSAYEKNSYEKNSYERNYDRDRKPYSRYAEVGEKNFDSKPRNSKYGEVVYQGNTFKKKSNVVITNGNYRSSYRTGGYTRNDGARQGYSGYQNRNQYDK